MKRAACLDSNPADDSLVDNSLVDDMELLADLLEASYKATYKGSSLKVRRRYRKLLVALEAARLERTQAAAYRIIGEHEVVALRNSFSR